MQWYSSRRLFELANKDTSILHRELRKSFTTVLSGDSRRFERTHFACSLVLRFKKTRTRRAPTYPSLRQTTHINHRRLQHVQLTEGGSVLRRPNGVHVHVLRDAQGAEVPQVQDRKELRPIARISPDARRVKPIAPSFVCFPSLSHAFDKVVPFKPSRHHTTTEYA